MGLFLPVSLQFEGRRVAVRKLARRPGFEDLPDPHDTAVRIAQCHLRSGDAAATR
ncbi:hypothetical protein [Variovorax sp. dw_954]|uniref:hypothetical protein n=1 Tax=Variovorax sp. dw_954 TaxID=2720078 RepID=UPI001BD4DEA7|nr:hypothetical protein [Variovorax sp. dw_954]